MSFSEASTTRRTIRVSTNNSSNSSQRGDVNELGIARRITGRQPTRRLLTRCMSSSSSTRSSVFSASGNYVTNLFIADLEIDPDDSEFHFQYIHITLENLLTEAANNKRLRATAEAPLSEKHLARLAAFLKRVRERLKGDACMRLLRCIQQVIQTRKQNRLQVLLQHMFLVNAGLVNNRTRPLPASMESPRTTVHVTNRMRHFERLREEGDKIVHYVHPSQIPYARVGTPLTVSNVSSDARTSTPSNRFRRSKDAKLPVAHNSRVGTPGTVSAMAEKARTLGRMGFQSDVTMVGEEGEFDGDWQNVVGSWAGKPRKASLEEGSCFENLRILPGQDKKRNQNAQDKKRNNSKQKLEPFTAKRLVEYGSEPPPPELSGATGGFMSGSIKRKHLLKLPCNKEKMPSLLSKESLDEESEAERHRQRKGKSQYSRENPPLALFDQTLLRSSTSNSIGRLSCLSDLSGRTQDLGCGREPSSRTLTSNLKASSTGNLKSKLGHRGLLECSIKDHASDAIIVENDVYRNNLDNLTQYFMQTRGLEKSHIPSSAARDAEFRRLLRKAVRPKSPIHREAAFPGSSIWESGVEDMTIIERCNTPEVSYARECVNAKVSPSIIKFLAEPSSKLDLGHYLIGDEDLQALLNAMLSQQSIDMNSNMRSKHVAITDISLLGNRRLSDQMLSYFFATAILGNKEAGIKPCVGLVKSLSLGDCIGFGSKSLDTMCSLLNRGHELSYLQELDIQGIEIAATSWTKMTEAFRNSMSLRKLGLARTGCGKHSQKSCRAVADLIESGACKNLQSLDISGNHFHHEGCVALGEALKKAEDKFEEFDLSHNAGLASDLNSSETSSREQTSFNPIMHVLEALGETTVKRVAFAECQLTYEEDCILEDSVDSSDITHLEISGNPHGEQGLRCIVRLLARNRKSAQQIEYLGLDTIRNAPLQHDTYKYDFVNPSAEYQLSLRNPQHRSVLKLILKRSEESGGHFTCFSHEKLNGKHIQNGLQTLCTKRMDRGGDDWQVPCEGVLSFTFQLPSCYDPRDSLKTVFRKFERGQKLKVDFDGFARVLRLFRTMKDQRSQMVMLCAMSRDIVFKLCHIKYFGDQSRDLFAYILVTLLPTLEEDTSRTVLFDLIDNSAGGQARQIKMEAKNLLYFNALHPDNHYELNLPNLIDRGTAQRCLVISSWVRNRSIALDRLDLSEYGNYECLRNTYLSRHKFAFDSLAWQLPDEGVFVFDVVLPRMPLDAKECLDQLTVKDLLNALMVSPCKIEHKLSALRLVAHRLVLAPRELVTILKQFPPCRPDNPVAASLGYRPRVEAYILLYNRTLYHSLVVSPSVLYNLVLFQPGETQEIRDRQGWIHTFDAVNVHSELSNLGNRHGPLDMHSHDGWLIVKLLIFISFTEGSINFTDCKWSPKENLYNRGYAFCIPKEWVPNPPRYGHFTCNFASKPEEIHWSKRDELAVEHLGWTYPPPR